MYMEINEAEHLSIKHIPVKKVNDLSSTLLTDPLSVEEPLEIRLRFDQEKKRISKSIAVTMRTPGNDTDLAIGFLFTEGIISSYQQIKEVAHNGMICASQKENIIEIDLCDGVVPNLIQSERNFYTTSSCGVCGKSSIQSIKTVSPFKFIERPLLELAAATLFQLPGKLRGAQNNFSVTGGIHASGLFTIDGRLLLSREDVGRHNALDKLIGNALLNNLLPLNQNILLLSGRASFELIQKAAMAGIAIVTAIGAPSSLAVDVAKEFDITLLGFLKENRFNIYHLSKHISIPALYEN